MKRISCRASNALFQVRILVGVLFNARSSKGRIRRSERFDDGSIPSLAALIERVALDD